MLNPAVLDRIMERLLQHSKHAKRDIRRNGARHAFMTEVDHHSLLLRELFAQAFSRGHNSKVFQLRRMQTMGYCLHIVTNFNYLSAEPMDIGADFANRERRVLRELLEFDRQ